MNKKTDTTTATRHRIEIKETIDGVSADSPACSANKKPADNTPKPRRGDPYIWGIYITLLIISVVELFSASSSEIETEGNVYGPLIRHGIFLGLGLVAAILCQNLHYKYFRKLSWAFAFISLALVLYSTFAGVSFNGASRAINVLGFTIQPAEIAKLAIVMLLASIMSKHQMSRGVTTSGVVWSALMVIIFGGCLWFNGLTNAFLLMGVSFIMFIIGGIQGKKIVAIVIVYAIFGGGLFLFKYSDNSNAETTELAIDGNEAQIIESGNEKLAGRSGTHKGRLRRYLEGVSPNDTIDDENRQVIFARFAIANGGLLGNGPGNSRESSRLPLAFSDYIYSIVVEDTGFVGGTLLLFLYLALVFRAGRIAQKCSRAFPAIFIMGCAVMIAFQAMVHMGIVTGVFPVSGQPLPLISKGGTSILVMSLTIGMMLSVSKFAVQNGTKKEIKNELAELPEDMQSDNPTQLTYKE